MLTSGNTMRLIASLKPLPRCHIDRVCVCSSDTIPIREFYTIKKKKADIENVSGARFVDQFTLQAAMGGYHP